MEHLDVLIVGAGISGIGAAVHLKRRCPQRHFAILEGRAELGGTWDLFRYPGVRSDSDMYTLGFSFRPWTAPQAIVDGASVLGYLKDTARDHGLSETIRFGHFVQSASWSSATARWTVTAERRSTGETVQLSCNFLYMCSGYYDYTKGYCPEFPGAERFAGRIVHPQHWTPDIDCAGKRVIVIGSGATALTLVPALAKTASHVTLLQRSPSYVIGLPARDSLVAWQGRAFPARFAAALARWRNILLGLYFFQLCRHAPRLARKLLLYKVRRQLGPDYDVETHFSPSYDPWQQRLCVASDSDLFKAIRSGQASVVTDHVEAFSESGLTLRSGKQLPADVVVMATGLDLQLMSNLQIVVDGARLDAARSLTYRGMMFSGIPNLVSSFGYTNASWTLRSELIAKYVCRLLNYMQKRGYQQCRPRPRAELGPRQPFVDFSSGYVRRGVDRFPGQSDRAPWRVDQNYLRDRLTLSWVGFSDGSLDFSSPSAAEGTGVDRREGQTA
jgi:monooxygenase